MATQRLGTQMRMHAVFNLTIIVITAILGFFMGISFPMLSLLKISFLYNGEFPIDQSCDGSCSKLDEHGNLKIHDTRNPKGTETLPRRIIESESDLYQRRLWGDPVEDIINMPKYLVAFTVGDGVMKENVNNAIKKFSDNFTIILFHYDGHVNEWDEYEWSKKVIHIRAIKQTKWWYAKRFMHPDVVAPYEYIFIWDEDLGVDNFNAEQYIEMVRKYELEISQPAVVADHGGFQWQMTRRQSGQDVHREVQERAGWCPDPHLPPCASFVEIMAPVFSRNAWRCVWHMIQNDLVHGWGLDFAIRRCVEPAYEKMGVVDSQWISHRGVPTLINQGQGQNENSSIRKRCRHEWKLFDSRMIDAEKEYYTMMGIDPPNSNKTANSTSS